MGLPKLDTIPFTDAAASPPHTPQHIPARADAPSASTTPLPNQHKYNLPPSNQPSTGDNLNHQPQQPHVPTYEGHSIRTTLPLPEIATVIPSPPILQSNNELNSDPAPDYRKQKNNQNELPNKAKNKPNPTYLPNNV